MALLTLEEEVEGIDMHLVEPTGVTGTLQGQAATAVTRKLAAQKDGALPCESGTALGQDPERWRDPHPWRPSKLNGNATL